MSFIIDTNILLNLIRNQSFYFKFRQKYYRNDGIIGYSIVTKGEVDSIALQNNWGNQKITLKNQFLEGFLEIPVNSQDLINTYAEIDAFSQNKLANKPLGLSARNMGKNDLWIASTTHITNSTLITSDQDFNHLQNHYFNVELVNVKDFV